jgi:hypothetical protein
MRHPEPAIVTHYRQTLKAEVPQLCHTCDHYTKQGICSQFDEPPPEAFANEPGECSMWVWEIPF